MRLDEATVRALAACEDYYDEIRYGHEPGHPHRGHNVDAEDVRALAADNLAMRAAIAEWSEAQKAWADANTKLARLDAALNGEGQ